MVAPGEGVRGCSGGACMVARGACMVAPGGHVWLLQGGMCGCSGGHAWLPPGVCVVAPGGMHGFLGGMHGFFWGCAWFLLGGMHGFFWGGMRGFFQGVCVVFSGGGVRRIRRDTVNERPVRILLECILVLKDGRAASVPFHGSANVLYSL